MQSHGLIEGSEGRPSCFWHGSDTEYIAYHDQEWGSPEADDIRLFEKICLEGFQSGLSWLTILRKRENFRRAFSGFDYHRLAHFGTADVERLLQDAGIVRHRGKIASVINNAARAIELEREFGSLAAYFWRFEPKEDERPARIDRASLAAFPQTPASVRLSRDLRKRGWSFVGPTTAHAFMQAMGMVNDHLEGCWRREQVERERADFVRPGK